MIRTPLLMAAAVGLAATGGSVAAPNDASFATFHQRAEAGKNLSVVFLGGSLTWGAQSTNPQETSYRARVSQRLQERYPKAHFAFGDAAIGGTGSQLGSFRLERDVMARKPDLVFLDFTINDGAYNEPTASKLSSYESLVRRLVQAGVPVVQVVLPAKADLNTPPPARPLDAPHKAIGAAYGLPLADAVAEVQQAAAKGEATADEMWDLPEDRTHPGDVGYSLYARAAWRAYQDAVAKGQVCRAPEKMLNGDTYMTVNRFTLAPGKALPAGWQPGKPHRNAVAYDFVCSRWMDDLAIAGPGAQPLKVKVKAADLLLFGERTQKSGSYTVAIDGGEPKPYKAHCQDGNMRLVEVIAEGLDPAKEHEVVITPVLEDGQELRLESVCAAGAPATVEIATP